MSLGTYFLRENEHSQAIFIGKTGFFPMRKLLKRICVRAIIYDFHREKWVYKYPFHWEKRLFHWENQ